VQYRSLDRFPDVKVIPAKLPINAAMAARIEDIWTMEKKRAGDALFNGRIFSLLPHDGSRMTGFFIDYKYWLAARRDRELRRTLNILPLAVSGIIRCKEGLVFGRRHDRVQAPGLWELLPGGSVDETALRSDEMVDVRAQFITELREEAGIEETQVTAITCRGLLTDPDEPVADIVATLDVTTDAAHLHNLMSLNILREHQDLAIVPVHDIDNFLEEHKGQFVAATLRILQERIF
jgi:hypothetical protein